MSLCRIAISDNFSGSATRYSISDLALRMQPAEELNENNHLSSEFETWRSMTHTAIPCYCKLSDRLLKRRSLTAFLILVMACCTGAFAEDVSQPNHPPSSLPATHLLGFAGARNNSKGTLSIEGDGLQFKKNGSAAVQVKIASIHDLSLGDLSRQVGGVLVTSQGRGSI